MPQIPTIGRIMYYYQIIRHDKELPVPMPIIISSVSDDGKHVSGLVIDKLGSSFPAQNVFVIQPEEEIPFGSHLYEIAMWMPYQVASHAAASQTPAISLVP